MTEVQVDYVVKSYSGKIVVDDISLSVQQGEIFGLIGPNGAGKTTTVGRYDVVAGVRFRSMDELSDFIAKTLPQIDGVKDSETFICLKGKKNGPYLTLT